MREKFNKLKAKLKTLSFYYYFLFINFIVLIVIVFTLMISFNFYFKNQYTKLFYNELELIKQTVSVSLKPLILTEDYDRIEKLLLGWIKGTQIETIKLANPSGEIILSVKSTNNQTVIQYVPNEMITSQAELLIDNDENVTIIFPIIGIMENDILSWVEIRYSKKILSEIISNTIRLFLLMSILGTILIAVFLRVLFKYFEKELKIFTTYLKDIPLSKGKILDHTFTSKEFQELKNVSEKISQILYTQEKELIREKSKIEKILSSLTEVVIFTDFNLNIIYANNAFERHFNMNVESIINKQLNQILNLLDSDNKTNFWTKFELYKDLINNDIVHSDIFFDEVYYQTTDNFLKIFEITVIPIKETDLSGLLFLIRDVTHRKLIEKELSKIQKFEAIDRLAGGVAHDLRNLLAGLYNYFQILKLKTRDSTELNLIERIEKILERASALSFQLLSLSKGGAPIKKAVNLEELIQEVAEFCFSGAPIKFELKVKTKIDKIFFDPQQIALVFQNLFINAREAMPEGGKVIVETDLRDLMDEEIPPLPRGTYVVISVSDTGPGIPQDILPHIFDPFFTTKEKGTGLGLTLVYQIMKNHGGYVTVDTEVGRGTTFYLYLPYEVGTVEEDHPKLGGEERSYSAKKVLIVDDEEDIRESLVYILREFGHEAYSAGNADEAIKIFSEELHAGRPFGIVIIDYTMPDMSGDKLLNKLREIHPDFLAVLSTGYADIPAVTDYSEFGFDRILLKPYTIDQLLKVISS